MFSLLKKRNLPGVTLAVGAASLIPFLVPGLRDVFSYDRNVPFELWRAITCHGVHWNGEHLFWSLGTFLGLGWLCESRGLKPFLIALGIAALIIPAALFLFQPQFLLYGGLSGLDSALFGLAAIGILREKIVARDWGMVAVGAGLLGAFVAKISYEFVTSGAVFVSDMSGMIPVPLAHIVGIAIGAATALVCKHAQTADQ